MSETVKHTPGNWEVDERKSYFGVFSMPPAGWLDQARLVAACAKPHKDASANARLIAAAPDLLEALKDALWAIDNITAILTAQGVSVTLADPTPRIRAAIAKAEGRP